VKEFNKIHEVVIWGVVLFVGIALLLFTYFFESKSSYFESGIALILLGGINLYLSIRAKQKN